MESRRSRVTTEWEPTLIMPRSVIIRVAMARLIPLVSRPNRLKFLVMDPTNLQVQAVFRSSSIRVTELSPYLLLRNRHPRSQSSRSRAQVNHPTSLSSRLKEAVNSSSNMQPPPVGPRSYPWLVLFHLEATTTPCSHSHRHTPFRPRRQNKRSTKRVHNTQRFTLNPFRRL